MAKNKIIYIYIGICVGQINKGFHYSYTLQSANKGIEIKIEHLHEGSNLTVAFFKMFWAITSVLSYAVAIVKCGSP